MKYLIQIRYKSGRIKFSTERVLPWYSGAVSIAERLLIEKIPKAKGGYYTIVEIGK